MSEGKKVINPRKSPLRIRRKSTKEFSRVAELLRNAMQQNRDRIFDLEERVAKLEKTKRTRKPKTEKGKGKTNPE